MENNLDNLNLNKSMATVAEIWHRIHNWLAKNSPVLKQGLNGGASDQEIQKLEETTGVELPSDFVASYQIHNGGSSDYAMFQNHSFLSVDEIIEDWKITKSVWVQDDNNNATGDSNHKDPDLEIQDKWWDPKWIPFGKNGCGDNIVIDLAPTEAGSLGQVFEWSHDDNTHECLASNFAEYLQNFAEELEDGKYKVSEEGSLEKDDE